MLKELMSLYDLIDSNKLKSPPLDRLVVVETDGTYEFLESNEKIKDWLNKKEHFREILNNYDAYLAPMGNAKCVGTKNGLLTMLPVLFQLKKENFENLKRSPCNIISNKKCKCFFCKTKKTSYNKNDSIEESTPGLVDEIHQTISKFHNNFLSSETDQMEKLKDSLIIIDVNEEKLQHFLDIYKKNFGRKLFLSENMIKDGNCDFCNIQTKVGPFYFLNAYNDKTPYVNHNFSGTHYATQNLCTSCCKKLHIIITFLKNKKVKIFPLFIDLDLRKREIKLIDKTEKNHFRFILNKIPKNKFDFYLVVFPAFDELFIDYIFNYRWKLNEIRLFYGEKINATRSNIEYLFSKSWNLRFFNYFSNEKEIKELVPFKKMIFNFVYRSDSTFFKSEQNLCSFVCDSIKYVLTLDTGDLPESSKRFNVQAALDLWFNRKIIFGDGFMDTDEKPELERLRELRSKLFDGKELSFDGDTKSQLQKWAYSSGLLYRYLICQSKSKSGGLMLEPVVHCSTVSQMLTILTRTLEKYQHAIDKKHHKMDSLFSNSLVQNNSNEPFKPLKPYFYAGYFDFSFDLLKKKEDVTGENNE